MDTSVDLLQTFFCWSTLIVTVAGLATAFFFTNITSFARKVRQGKTDVKVPVSGGTVNDSELI